MWQDCCWGRLSPFFHCSSSSCQLHLLFCGCLFGTRFWGWKPLHVIWSGADGDNSWVGSLYWIPKLPSGPTSSFLWSASPVDVINLPRESFTPNVGTDQLTVHLMQDSGGIFDINSGVLEMSLSEAEWSLVNLTCHVGFDTWDNIKDYHQMVDWPAQAHTLLHTCGDLFPLPPCCS